MKKGLNGVKQVDDRTFTLSEADAAVVFRYSPINDSLSFELVMPQQGDEETVHPSSWYATVLGLVLSSPDLMAMAEQRAIHTLRAAEQDGDPGVV